MIELKIVLRQIFSLNVHFNDFGLIFSVHVVNILGYRRTAPNNVNFDEMVDFDHMNCISKLRIYSRHTLK